MSAPYDWATDDSGLADNDAPRIVFLCPWPGCESLRFSDVAGLVEHTAEEHDAVFELPRPYVAVPNPFLFNRRSQ